MKVKLFFAATAILLSSSQAWAWGQTGHRVTGAVAEYYLSPQAQAMIAKLLPNEGLAEASTYPDEMRSHPSEYWQKTASPFHYVTVPTDKSYAETEVPEHGDSVTALVHFSKVLKDPNAAFEDKQVALRFIVHIIGDLHQPLHVGRGDDRGGNDVKLKFFWQDSNLHRVWDSEMIDNQQLSFTEWTQWLQQKISAEQAKSWSTADPMVWIAESKQLRESGIYPEQDKLSWDYQFQHIPEVKVRLQQAGVRIATYLNQLFAK